jgi:hypothetical protein
LDYSVRFQFKDCRTENAKQGILRHIPAVRCRGARVQDDDEAIAIHLGVRIVKPIVELIIRPALGRWLLAGVAALLVVPLMVVPASANSHFMGVLKGSPPLSPPFVSSPASSDISSHPVTVVFTSKVENLTNHVVTVTVDIGVKHILTYYGRNVADGEPGKPGITFKSLAQVQNTTQVTYGTPFQRVLVVAPKGAPPQLVTFSTVMTMCGYFQFDIGKHFKNGSHENLSTGFARVLGCKHSGGGGGGGTGGVSGSTANGLVLAATGFPAAGGLLGALMVLIGGLGMRIRRR